MKKGLIFCILLLAVAALPVLAERPIDRVPAGLDYWQTLSSGATAYDFANNPIPAGFFCNGSTPFKGRINFEGVPLHTQPEGILGTTDTIIERLTDAVFDDSGTARTRIRARALNLRGTDILKNACGRFKVTADLPGNQPTSPMIFHSVDAMGGTFDAQLQLRVRVTFTNVDTAKSFSLLRDVYLPTVNNTPFAIGKAAAIACLDVSQTAIAEAGVTLADGSPLFSHPVTTREKVTAQPSDPIVAQPVPVVTGCYCQNGVCLRTYSWHDPCAGLTLAKCEQHWTYTPCQLGYTSQCTTQATQQNYLEQLKALHARGIINESPETVLRKQLRSAAEIERDQAALEREQINKQ